MYLLCSHLSERGKKMDRFNYCRNVSHFSSLIFRILHQRGAICRYFAPCQILFGKLWSLRCSQFPILLFRILLLTLFAFPMVINIAISMNPPYMSTHPNPWCVAQLLLTCQLPLKSSPVRAYPLSRDGFLGSKLQL